MTLANTATESVATITSAATKAADTNSVETGFSDGTELATRASAD